MHDITFQLEPTFDHTGETKPQVYTVHMCICMCMHSSMDMQSVFNIQTDDMIYTLNQLFNYVDGRALQLYYVILFLYTS